MASARIRWLAEGHCIERERAAVERRMLVAQKRESLGVLAGGVAHDLNNLLTVIIIHSHLVARGAPGLPCLFATDYTSDLLPERNASDTPIEVLAKPFEPDELLRAIRRALS